MQSRLGRFLVASAQLSVLLATAGGVAAAPNTGCPAAFEAVAVAQAVSEGYLTTPARKDANGNQDGIVCRVPLGEGVLRSFPNATVDTIYVWLDNSTPQNG
jgi:hypothetical protein